MDISKDYLKIILLLILLIIVIWVIQLLTTPPFIDGRDATFYPCQQAAATCKTALAQVPDDKCTVCDTYCVYSNGTEIFNSAITCCKLGNVDMVYRGSPGCH